MAYIGKESEKTVDMCICITDSFCHAAETNYNIVNQLYSNKKKKQLSYNCKITPKTSHTHDILYGDRCTHSKGLVITGLRQQARDCS